jgi:hypothetical protein
MLLIGVGFEREEHDKLCGVKAARDNPTKNVLNITYKE